MIILFEILKKKVDIRNYSSDSGSSINQWSHFHKVTATDAI